MKIDTRTRDDFRTTAQAREIAERYRTAVASARVMCELARHLKNFSTEYTGQKNAVGHQLNHPCLARKG